MTTDHPDHRIEEPSEQVVLQQHQISESTRTHSTIIDPEYVDQFILATNAAAVGSPEQWARAALEGVAGVMGQIVWRGLLGLRLEWKSAPGQVAHWPIVDRGDTWVTLGARSWMLSCNLVIEVDDEHASLATFIRFERPIGERVWKTVSARHRSLAPSLLRGAWNLRRAT
ncbi:hypothetical protein ACLMAJ_28660 [Nocardia sp. KC 131]|uniref:hypothetical protein n=1 Tax=Nocardia arseniciresistens TaxID=3392119 RepID=UPI00398F84DD